jgi:cytochrome c oxidase cbb3-type subunit III
MISKRKQFQVFKLLLLIITFFSAGNVFAEGENTFPPSYYDLVASILIILIIISFVAIIYFEGREQTEIDFGSFFAKIWTFVNRSTPIEDEKDILLDHDYDGIRELDSRVPPWFSWLFYLTILFAIYYMLNYHVLGTGKLMYEEYNDEMQTAAIQRAELISTGAFLNEETVTRLTDPAAIDKGKQIFSTNCVACHGTDGGGIVGPNLTDKYWIHGGGIKNVFTTIKYGVANKGMISWQTQLNPNQIQQVASFVLSLQGTTPAAPKAPEGQIWEPPDSTSKN